MLTLTAISIDRFYAICHPLKFKTSLNQAKRIIALIWLVSLVTMTPDLIYLSAKRSQDLSEAGLDTVLYSDCNYDWSEEASRSFQFVKTILLYLVPFLLMFCAHYRILQVLRLASSMAHRELESIEPRRHSQATAPGATEGAGHGHKLVGSLQANHKPGPGHAYARHLAAAATNCHQASGRQAGRGSATSVQSEPDEGAGLLAAAGALCLRSLPSELARPAGDGGGGPPSVSTSGSLSNSPSGSGAPTVAELRLPPLVNKQRASEISPDWRQVRFTDTLASLANATATTLVPAPGHQAPTSGGRARQRKSKRSALSLFKSKKRDRRKKQLQELLLLRNSLDSFTSSPPADTTVTMMQDTCLQAHASGGAIVCRPPSGYSLVVPRAPPTTTATGDRRKGSRDDAGSESGASRLSAGGLELAGSGTVGSEAGGAVMASEAFILTMHNKNKLESRRKAAKMLTAIVVLFGICYLPVHLINFLR